MQPSVPEWLQDGGEKKSARLAVSRPFPHPFTTRLKQEDRDGRKGKADGPLLTPTRSLLALAPNGPVGWISVLRRSAVERRGSADSGHSATVGEFVGFGPPKLSFKFRIGMAHRDPKRISNRFCATNTRALS